MTNNVQFKAVTGCEFCGKQDLLSSVEGKTVCHHCKYVFIEANPFLRLVGKTLNGIEAGLIHLNNAMLNSKMVVSAAQSVIGGRLQAVLLVREASRRTIRLFGKEGMQLSRKSDIRMVWYTSPVTAKELHEYMGGETGRMVYVDMELDCLSDYVHRFYKVGDEAFTLKGDLITMAKRKWKYATDADIAKSVLYMTHLQVAAGMEIEEGAVTRVRGGITEDN